MPLAMAAERSLQLLRKGGCDIARAQIEVRVVAPHHTDAAKQHTTRMTLKELERTSQ